MKDEFINPHDIICAAPFAPIPNCILKSPQLSDQEKLLLGRLYQYAGKKGIAWPHRKTLADELGWNMQKLKRTLSLLKSNKLIQTKVTRQNAPRVFSFLNNDIYDNGELSQGVGTNMYPLDAKEVGGGYKYDPTINTIENNSDISIPYGIRALPKRGKAGDGIGTKRTLPTQKPLPKKSVLMRKMKNESIVLIKHWNSYKSLVAHKLTCSNDGEFYLQEQTVTVQNIDAAIRKLMRGTFYSSIDDLPNSLVRKKFGVLDLQKIIKRVATFNTIQYSTKPRRLAFMDFVSNTHIRLGKGNDRFLFRYPLIHFAMNEPVPLEDKHTEKKTEYELLVKRVIKKLQDHRVVGTKWNTVVTQVEKAIGVIDQKANGNRLELRSRLPELLYDSLVIMNKGFTVSSLPLAVWNLDIMMKERGMIK